MSASGIVAIGDVIRAVGRKARRGLLALTLAGWALGGLAQAPGGATASGAAAPAATAAPAGTPTTAASEAQQTVDVRQDLVKPLGAAQEDLRAGRHAQALEQLRATDAVTDKTPVETYVIERMRAAAHSALGDLDSAAVSIERALDSGQTPVAEQAGLVDALVAVHYNRKRYKEAAQWASRFLRLATANPARREPVRTILAQSLYLAGDYAAAAGELQGLIQATRDAGRKPSQSQLDLFASCFIQLKDDAGYLLALEQLLTWYPRKEYWVDLLTRLERLSGFSRELVVDVFRLQFAAQAFTDANDYLEYAQLALKAGFHGESRTALTAGFSAQLLGQGPDAQRHQGYLKQVGERADDELKELNAPRLEGPRDSEDLFTLGWRQFTLGQVPTGIARMQEALDKGDLANLNFARLRLGTALFQSGDKLRARVLFKRVEDARVADGTSDLGRLWGLLARP